MLIYTNAFPDQIVNFSYSWVPIYELKTLYHVNLHKRRFLILICIFKNTVFSKIWLDLTLMNPRGTPPPLTGWFNALLINYREYSARQVMSLPRDDLG